MNKKWLIWSIEHNAWWRPAEHGYTTIRAEAGRYEYDRALEIVTRANEFTKETPNEAMLPE